MTNEEKAMLLDEPALSRIMMSPTIGKLAAAIARAQVKMVPAFKEALNPHTGKYYATLASCTQAAKPLHDEGVAVLQPPVIAREGYVAAQTLLVHAESGEWIGGILEMPVVAQTKKDGTKLPIDAQTYGSSLSYVRRYSLSSMILLATTDDDAESSASMSREHAAPAPQLAPKANGTAKPANKPGPAKAAPKAEPKAPPPPAEESFPEEPEADLDEAPGMKVADVLAAVPKASSPELLTSTWALREKVDPKGHQLLWSAVEARGVELLGQATAEDMKAWHRTIVDNGKPAAWTKAYTDRFNEIKAQQAGSAT